MMSDYVMAVVVGVFCASIYMLIFNLFKTIKTQHKKTLDYIFQTVKAKKEPLPPNVTQLHPTRKRRKGKAYVPSKDVEKVLDGDLIDDWD